MVTLQNAQGADMKFETINEAHAFLNSLKLSLRQSTTSFPSNPSDPSEYTVRESFYSRGEYAKPTYVLIYKSFRQS